MALRGLAAVAALFAVHGGAVAALATDEPIVLPATTAWNVDYAENSCGLRRGFGGEGSQVFVEFRQSFPGSRVTLMLIADGIEIVDEPLVLQFGSEQPLRMMDAQRIDGADGFEGFLDYVTIFPPRPRRDYDYDEDRAAREQEVSAITISEVFDRDVRLDTGTLHPAMTALRSCVDDLMESWGVDLAAFGEAQTPVRPIARDEWVRDVIRHYPRGALRRGRSNYVDVTLLVGPDGRAVQCRAGNGLGREDFEQVACAAIMEYARFEPAMTADGRPVHGTWHTRVHYLAN